MMKAVAVLVLALCAINVAPAATLRKERLWMFGREYYRLDDWARANGFQVSWTGKKDVQVTNRAARLSFTGDSRRMILNGVAVTLSNDIVTKNGVAYVTPFDVDSTLAPILWPVRDPKTRVKRICVDAGHGGRDMGEHAGGDQEKKYTLLLAQDLAGELTKAGYTVSLTRASDLYVDREARVDIARRRNADLFISLHFNSDGRVGSDARGVETYCLTPPGANSTNDRLLAGSNRALSANRNDARNILLAYQIQKAVLGATGSEDRGVKRARFEVLGKAAMPAVLIESGFLSNTAEARKITSPAWRKQVAQAITKGIRSYCSLMEKPER